MSYRSFHRRRWICIPALVIAVFAGGTRAPAQDRPDAPLAVVADQDEALHFSFEGAPWREVIKWLADSAGLALHIGDLPTGSFSYIDQNSFTPQEAIDRVNLFLQPEGFTLVRSGGLLSLINLTDRLSAQRLDSLAKMVSVEQLEQTSDHDVVKCIFPLGELDADEAVGELSALNLMVTPAIFPRTNQLLITDTAGKLKSAKAVLDSFEPNALANGTVVKSFELSHADAEDVLTVARPHLGLATGEMIGIDVSLSADLQGKNIFVTGVEDKVKLIEGLIAAIDQPDKTLSTTSGDAVLKSYIVEGGNVDTVYNVLLTLLAGKDVRLSSDEAAGTIVALASPEVQTEIEATVLQLQAADAEFAVIPLRTIDPYLAVSLLEEMLDLAEAKRRASAGIEAFTQHGNSRGVDIMNDNMDSGVPRIDADPVNRRLFVRAKKHQIEQIKEIVAELDVSSSVGGSDRIRLYPLRGRHAEQTLETAAKFWRRPNPVFYYPSMDPSESEVVERVVNKQLTIDDLLEEPQEFAAPSPRLLTRNVDSQAPAMRCQLTLRGLLLQCEDTEALDQFEDHLRTIAGPADTMPSPPIVFYLKYTRPGEALQMLAELLDGGEVAREGDSGTLVNGYVSTAAGSFLGSIVSSREGTMTMMAGTITVVADSRLNRLIAQGTASDLELIEDYLKIIDKDKSITSIETYGTSHVIELEYTTATEVAAALRDAYPGRVSGGRTAAGQPGTPQEQQAQREAAAAAAKAAAAAARAGDKKGAEPKASPGQQARDLEPKMTIAVHAPSNSLIVTAPEQLFKEVEALARLIDSRSKRSVRIFHVPDAAARSSLQELFSGGSGSGGDGAARGASSSKAKSGR